MDDYLIEVGRELAGDADALARRVTERWSELSREEPWLSRLTTLRQDHLPDLIRALARLALVDPEGEEAARALIEEGRRHGASRREEGHEDTIIPAEYVLLRRSLRHILVRERRTPPHLLLPAVALLEAAIGVGEVASLHGYHGTAAERPDPERAGRILDEWTGLVHEIIEER